MYVGDTFELEGSSLQVSTDERQHSIDGISASCKESFIPDYDNVIKCFKEKCQYQHQTRQRLKICMGVEDTGYNASGGVITQNFIKAKLYLNA